MEIVAVGSRSHHRTASGCVRSLASFSPDLPWLEEVKKIFHGGRGSKAAVGLGLGLGLGLGEI